MNHPYRTANLAKLTLAPKASLFHKLSAYFNGTLKKLSLKREGYCVICRDILLNEFSGGDYGPGDYTFHLRLFGKPKYCVCRDNTKRCVGCGYCDKAILNRAYNRR